MEEGRKVPSTIYSTFDKEGVRNPEFNSLVYGKKLSNHTSTAIDQERGTTNQVYYPVKLFSSSPPSATLLANLFGTTIARVYRKEWDAYPVLSPIHHETDLSGIRIEQGIYYVNGFERLISTMETQVRFSLSLESGRMGN